MFIKVFPWDAHLREGRIADAEFMVQCRPRIRFGQLLWGALELEWPFWVSQNWAEVFRPLYCHYQLVIGCGLPRKGFTWAGSFSSGEAIPEGLTDSTPAVKFFPEWGAEQCLSSAYQNSPVSTRSDQFVFLVSLTHGFKYVLYRKLAIDL